jgi:hypothetical protein
MKWVYAEIYRRLTMLVLADYGLNLLPTEVSYVTIKSFSKAL